MVIQAKLADGTTLEFPDETDEAVIERTVQQQIIQQHRPADTSILGTIKTQGWQGITGAIGDEIQSAIAAPLATAMRGQEFTWENLKENYNKGQNIQNNEIKAQQDENPWTSGLSQLGGGLVTAGAAALSVPGKALAARLGAGTAEQQLSKAALTGAAAASGYTGAAAEGDLAERGEAVLQALPLNTALGAAAPVAAPVVAKAARKTGDALSKTGEVLKNATVGREADELLASRLQGQDLQAMRDELARSGDMASIADVATPETRSLMRTTARQTGGPRNDITTYLTERSEGAVERGNQYLTNSISAKERYFSTLDDIAEDRAKAASPLYASAFGANKTIDSPAIDRVLATPAGSAALKQASIKMQNDMARMGTLDAELAEQARLAGQEVPGGGVKGLNLRSLDYVKRALDDQISVAKRVGAKDDVGILTELKNKLVSELDASDVTGRAGPNSRKADGGDYAKARKIYSDSYALEEAQESGLKFATKQPEEVARDVARMTPAEKDAYLIGVRENLRQTLENSADEADIYKRLLGNTQKRNRLRAALGSDEAYKEFADQMVQEKKAAITKFRVLGGSNTDFNIEDDGAAMVDAMRNLANDGKEGLLKQAREALAHGMEKRYIGLTKKNAQTLANIFTSKEQGLAALDRIIAANKGNAKQAQLLNQAKDEFPALLGINSPMSGYTQTPAPQVGGVPTVRVGEATQVYPTE